MDTVKNYWKQLVAWGTRSRRKSGNEVLALVRLRITVVSIVLFIFTLIISGVLIEVNLVDSLASSSVAQNYPTEGITGMNIMSSILEMLEDAIWGKRLFIFVPMAIIFYILSGYMLRPLEQANIDQRRFVANVSHELRTPLTILKTNAEVALLQGNILDRDEAIKVIKGSIEEVDRMSKIIQFFLNFSSFKNKSDTLQRSQINLSLVVAKTISIMQRLALQKDISLDMSASSNIFVWGNATALEDMLLNLIRNALNYTPNGGLVHIAIHDEESVTVLSVKDSGVGIAPNDLPHVFEPFYKGLNTASKKDGVGLGLAIVREIADMHRATIDVHSKAGMGTTFFIRFPRLK